MFLIALYRAIFFSIGYSKSLSVFHSKIDRKIKWKPAEIYNNEQHHILLSTSLKKCVVSSSNLQNIFFFQFTNIFLGIQKVNLQLQSFFAMSFLSFDFDASPNLALLTILITTITVFVFQSYICISQSLFCFTLSFSLIFQCFV